MDIKEEMSKREIIYLLNILIDDLNKKKINAVITIYGGSAIEYYFENRGVILDIDSVYEPYDEINSIIKEIKERNTKLRKNELRDILR